MLAFGRDDGGPVALIPGRTGRYRVVDPATGGSAAVNAGKAAGLAEEAWYFYQRLPNHRPAGAGDLLLVGTKNVGMDLVRFVVAGLLYSALTMAPAVGVGLLVSWVIPGASVSALVYIVAALVAVAMVGALLQMVRGMAMMSLEARVTVRMAAASWDRLLGLPQSYFGRFTAGDLAVRMSVFQSLRDQVSGAVANELVPAVFLLPLMGLLFFYNVSLASATLGLGVAALVVSGMLGMLQVASQRRRYLASRQLGSQLYQFISGMSKLRISGAEGSAFAAWARTYRERQLAELQIGRLNDHLFAFSATLPALAGAVIFAVALWQGPAQLTVAAFVVVYAGSMIFYTSVVQLGRSFDGIAALAPGYEQVRPVLKAVPDSSSEGTAPAELGGDIWFDRVSFRYSEDGPLVIDDVSIRARPGEFIAIVGESGCGKSTLMRLALGLEEPLAGAIYYDERDLAHLDRRTVRKQLGVVMQDGLLRPGDILTNIVGPGGEFTIDDAWRVARLAAVDRDIAAMPMGMFTVVNDGSATFSGGQAQRIRVAAALLRNPRIVFLDEATSWLDARSQADVMRSIDGLVVTRLVIAHRLSTIRQADRIYVLENRRVIQEGGFEELLEEEGLFRQLVQRQTL